MTLRNSVTFVALMQQVFCQPPINTEEEANEFYKRVFITHKMPGRHAIMKELALAQQESLHLDDLLKAKKKQIENIEKLITKMTRRIKHLELEIERQNHQVKEVQNYTLEKHMEASAFLEENQRAKQEVIAKIEKVYQDMAPITNENAKFHELLADVNEKMNNLVKCLGPDNAMDAKVLSQKDVQSCPGMTKEPTPSFVHTKSKLEAEGSKYGNILKQHFSSPQQTLDAMDLLSRTVKDLNETCFKAEQMPVELQQTFNLKVQEIQDDTGELASQVNAQKDKINKTKEDILEKQQHIVKLKSEAHSVLPEAMVLKLSKIYDCCMNRPSTYKNIQEKMTYIEHEVVNILDVIENIHDVKFDKLRRKVAAERRERQRKEWAILQNKKREEKVRKHQERACKPADKQKVQKIMFTSILRVKKRKDNNLRISKEKEDEINDYLYSSNEVIKSNLRKIPREPKKHGTSAKLTKIYPADQKPISDQPISNEDNTKSQDTSAIMEADADGCSPPDEGKNPLHHAQKNSLDTLKDTQITPSKQCLKLNKFKQDNLKSPNTFGERNAKEHRPATVVKKSLNCVKGAAKPSHMVETAQTQPFKHSFTFKELLPYWVFTSSPQNKLESQNV